MRELSSYIVLLQIYFETLINWKLHPLVALPGGRTCMHAPAMSTTEMLAYDWEEISCEPISCCTKDPMIGLVNILVQLHA